jgi:hypothetical protein
MSLEKPTKDSSAESSPAIFPGKRLASERRIEANRRNALRSTGPKTERGKRTVAGNAIKHGFLAREVVITAGDGKESLEEFHDFVEQLCEDYEPIGVVEESLVQTIAMCWWRKARVIRAENGEIRKPLDTLAVDRAQRNSEKGNRDLASLESTLGLFSAENQADRPVLTRAGASALREAQRDLDKSHVGLSFLTLLLQTAKSEIASDGYISEENRHKIYFAFCHWDYYFALACFLCGPPKEKKEERPSEKVADEQVVDEQTDKKDVIAAAIDDWLERISTLKRHATVRESLAADAEARSFSLPPADATDKLIRYEAHLDRQLYRAMDQLERLQRQRRGENVPPPLNINLGRRR